MKYHTTFSTIAISLLVLATFALAVLFCVISLGIASPGYLVATQILENLEGSLPFDISFESVDRNLSQKIVVNNIAIGQSGEDYVTVDALTIYQNPFSLIWSVLTGEGRVEIDVVGLTVTVPESSGEEGGGASFSVDDIESLVGEVRNSVRSLSDHSFYNLSYSVNVEDFTLNLSGPLSFADLSMHIFLSEGLVLDSFQISAPSISLSASDASLAATDLALVLERGDGGYRTRFSAASVDASYNDLSLALEKAAAELDFESFTGLDFRHLPIRLSTDSFELGSGSGSSISFSRTSVSAMDNGLDIVLLGTAIDAGGFGASLGRIDLRLLFQDESIQASFSTSDHLEIGYNGFAGVLGRLSGSVSFGNEATFDISLDSVSTDSMDGLTGGIYNALDASGITLSGQANSSDIFLEAGGHIDLSSPIAFFNSTVADFSASLVVENGALEEVSLSIPSVTLSQLHSPLSASILYDEGLLSGNISYADSVSINLARHSSLTISSLSLGEFSPIIETYAPVLEAYVDDGTVLNGSLEFTVPSFSDPFNGLELTGSLALSGIRFNENRFNLASSVNLSSNGENVEIDYFTLTSEWVRLSYTGYLSLDSLFPQGQLALELTDSGERLVEIDFTLDRQNEYYLDARLPRFENSYLRGSINWERAGLVLSEGELRSGSTVYPFTLETDFNEASVHLASSGLDFVLDFSDRLDIRIDFIDFALPTINANASVHSSLTGSFRYSFDVARQSYYGYTEDFSIDSFTLVHSRPSVSFDMRLDNDSLVFDNISLVDDFGTLEGMAVYVFQERSFAFTLGDELQRANLSLLLSGGNPSGILTLEGLSLDRFGLSGASVDTTLTGRGESRDDFSFSGTLHLGGPGYTLSADVVLTEEGVQSRNITYSGDSFTLSSSSLSYSASEGLLSMDASASYDRENRDRIYPVEADFSLEFYFKSFDTIVDAVLGSISEFVTMRWDARLDIDRLSVDNTFLITDRHLVFSYEDRLATASGNLIRGSFDVSSLVLDLTIEENPVAYGHISGSLDPEHLDLSLEGINFNLAFINWLCPIPLVNFLNEAWVYGDFVIYGDVEDTHIYGQGGSHGFDMTVWWVDNAYLHIGDTEVSVVDNHASTSMTPVVVVDYDNGDLHRGFAVAQALLNNSDILAWYDVEVWVPEGEDIHVRVPMYSQNIEINGDVNGNFNVHGNIDKINLTGQLNLSNSVMSVGMGPLPEWWGRSRFDVRNDYDIVLGGNCSFILPLSQQPIVRAYFDENVGFHFLYDTETMERAFTGELSFRSGEIYYFQKNFFITEGNITFPQNGTDLLSMRLNFRARLRSYTSDGERVDIFLVLNNATIDNINPTFESTPAMSTEEIMSILGQSLLPGSAYSGDSLSGVAGLVTSGVDVLNRMGVINTSSYADLSSVARESLGVDIFSMRTSILENFILDTVFSPSSYSFSPLASYLDNTSIYVGKYLGQDLYLQAMVYLQAVDAANNPASFLSDDLSLDLEISLEWETPLGVFTIFSRPSNLTLHSIFDNIGISYSNTIHF